MKINNPVLGFIIGALAPVLGFFIVFLIFREGQTLGGFMNWLMGSHQMLAKVLTLSVLANLLPFMYMTSKRIDLAARGVLSATIIYAVFIVLIKFVW
jgi:hypothetical protein